MSGNRKGLERIFMALVAALLVVLSAGAAAVARGYLSDDPELKTGMVVSLSTESTAEEQKVQRAALEDLDRIVGVTVSPADSDVTIASVNQKIFVESSGEADAYVSDLEGAVKQGDLLTLSPLKGIMTKGHSGSRIILGIALEDFADSPKEHYRVSSGDGWRDINIAKIRVNLDRQAQAGREPEPDSSLERLGHSVVGKDVSEIRVVIALLVFMVVLIAEGAILYGAISSAITSLGRNPLAQSIIKQELLKVVIITVIVLAFGLLAIYGILWV